MHRLVLLLAVYCAAQDPTLKCKTDAAVPGGDRDWFVTYMLPSGQLLTLDNQNAGAFTRVPTILDPASPLKITLDQYLSVVHAAVAQANAAKMSAVAYGNLLPGNQQLPISPARGIVITGTAFGSWMVHTLPQFADLSRGNQLAYVPQGKSGLVVCLTVAFAQMGPIFQSLKYAEAVPYFTRDGDNVKLLEQPAVMEFTSLAPSVIYPPYVQSFTVTTPDNLAVTAVGKRGRAQYDVYSRFLIMVLQSSVRVRFGSSAGFPLRNVCYGNFKTANIEGSVMVNGNQVTAADDGSVWAITEGQKKIFCISNSARTSRNEPLGSSVVCIPQDNVYAKFKEIADSSPKSKC